MSPYFPSGDLELADWSGDHMIGNLAGLPCRLPYCLEEQDTLALIAQVNIQLLTEGWVVTFTCFWMPVCKHFH